MLALVVVIGLADAATAGPIVGHVHDLDHLGGNGRTQVLLAPPTGPKVAVVTRSAAVQAVLQASLLTGLEAEIEAAGSDPATIVSVKLAVHPQPQREGRVQSVTCVESSGLCSASVAGHPEPVTTTDALALGVLLTAFEKRRPVSYLEFDASAEIKRVRIDMTSDR
jgi:hypothetical protein